ncbi:MAG: hypothetical protein JSS20_21155 [Proteobacteria bacterium]|nr:hypothetical protein [Pseudomonadota bacterium]
MTITNMKPRGEREVVSSEELGMDEVRAIVRRAKAANAKPVKDLLANANDASGVVARLWKKHPTKPGLTYPSTRAVTATGETTDGDALVTTYMHERLSVWTDEQAATIRYGINKLGLDMADGKPIFAWTGSWHLRELLGLHQAKFLDLPEHKVAGKVVREVREWTRGDSIGWLWLPPRASIEAAAELRAKIEAFQETETLLVRYIHDGCQPDPALIRRYEELWIGLDVWWMFIGAKYKIAYERDPYGATAPRDIPGGKIIEHE